MTVSMDSGEFADFVEGINSMSADEVAALESDLSAHKIKELSKQINKGRRILYPDRRQYQNEHVREVMREEEVRAFLSIIRSESVRCAFLLQFFYGLRIGEIGQVRYLDEAGVLHVDLLKTERFQRIPVHGQTDELLDVYYEYGDLSPRYLNKCFRSIRDDADDAFPDLDLAHIYGYAKDGKPLYQFKPHCLRKTAATYLVRETGSRMKMQEFLGHSKDGGKDRNSSTDVYHGYWEEEYREDLERAFEPYYDLI